MLVVGERGSGDDGAVPRVLSFGGPTIALEPVEALRGAPPTMGDG